MPRLALALIAMAAPPLPTAPFEAPKYGVKAAIPVAWEVVAREEDDRVFVALIPQSDPARPGALACELGLAPETLDEYRTRIDANAKREGRPGGKLVRNEVVKGPKGDQLETEWEFRPRSGVLWRERIVRKVAHRQLYTFTLNVDDATFPAAELAFGLLVDSAELSAPNTGADPIDPKANRWVQREFKFALDLPEGWRPVLAPDQVALFFANGPAHGIWSDNVLVLAQPHRDLDLKGLERTLPEELREVEPNCEVLSCRVIPQGKGEALETVVRTRRGPFSMTVLERRFRGGRYDYEVKYTVESKRFDELAPALRKSLDSFGEVPGITPTARPA